MDKETITPQMIAKCQEIMRSGQYDGNEFSVEVGPFAACTITQGLFPEILDMALEHLKRKASHTLVEWVPIQPKTSNITYVRKEGLKLKNTVLPKFDWNLVTPS